MRATIPIIRELKSLETNSKLNEEQRKLGENYTSYQLTARKHSAKPISKTRTNNKLKLTNNTHQFISHNKHLRITVYVCELVKYHKSSN